MNSLGVKTVRLSANVMWLGLALGASACSEPVVGAVSTEGESEGASDGGKEASTSGFGAGDASTSMGGGETGIDAGSGDTGVDGGTDESGEVEAVCGNGIVEVGEDCDDGIETATCNVNCTTAQCGDGIVNVPLGEQCDAGGPSELCDGDCTPVICGDGVANAAAEEECDGDDIAGGSCVGRGFVVGTLSCNLDCSYDESECYHHPDEPVLHLNFSQVKSFDFSWAEVGGAEYYQLEETATPGEMPVQLGGDHIGDLMGHLMGDSISVSHEVPLLFRWQASYRLSACNSGGSCTTSAVVEVMDGMADAVGYVKASNTDSGDYFGTSMALSGDRNTLVVGAPSERSFDTGVEGNQLDDSASDAGAVYVFERDASGAWSQQAYIKASNTDAYDRFGHDVALSFDGDTLVISATGEDSSATGIDGSQLDDSSGNSGAVYVFVRDGMGAWSQQSYIKASNGGSGDSFGSSISLGDDGDTLAVSAVGESSVAAGVGGEQSDDSLYSSGAVYVFVRDGGGGWSQQAYVKASNPDSGDYFGHAVSLSLDGDSLAVSAFREDSAAVGVGGDQFDNSLAYSGAVYVFVRDGLGGWSQQAYIKASNPDQYDYFGVSVELSGDGDSLAVGADGEGSITVGIDGNQDDDSANNSGAVYVFVRDGMGEWAQQAYVKASNTRANDYFGTSVAMSDNGEALVVGAIGEDSEATGIGGDEFSDSRGSSGAAYMFTLDGMGVWSQESYIKASNTGSSDQFGQDVSLSGDGVALVVSARSEYSNATGVGGEQANNSSPGSGAVYVY